MSVVTDDVAVEGDVLLEERLLFGCQHSDPCLLELHHSAWYRGVYKHSPRLDADGGWSILGPVRARRRLDHRLGLS
jgi:hypothetical protein